ncbi:VanZ family protein [Enterococcus sp. LJL90]
MKKNVFSFTLSAFVFAFVSYVLIRFIVMPTVAHYPRLLRAVERFEYTYQVLFLFLFLAMWLFFIQYQLKKISMVFLYLVISTYLFLLFIMLFAKATGYQALSLNPFDFIQADDRVLSEAVLNIVFLIPLGMIYGLGTNRWQYVVTALLTILGIETIQYVFYLGTFALSDIILNFIGTTIGWAVAKFLLRKFNQTI